MSKKISLKRWDNVSGSKLANAVFQVINGDCRRLVGDPDATDSIWGSIAEKLGNGFRTIMDRRWIKTSWDTDKLSVQTIHREICRVKSVELLKTREVNASLRFEKEGVYCICRKPEPEDADPDYTMIECDQCYKWYHCKCVGASKSKYGGSKEWNCPKCSGDQTVNFVPRIFLNSFRNNESTICSEGLEASTSGRGNMEDDFENFVANSGVAATYTIPLHGRSPLTQSKVTPEECPAFADEHDLAENISSLQPNMCRPLYQSTPINQIDEEQLAICSDEEQKEDELLDYESSQIYNVICDSENHSVLVNPQCFDGPTEYALNIKGVIFKKEWKQIKPSESEHFVDTRYKFRMTKHAWTHVFNDVLMRNCPDPMKGCVLAFSDGHRISVKTQRGVQFPSEITATGYCKRKPHLCKMKYDFTVKKIPQNNDDVAILINCYGTLMHDISIPDKRQFAGIKRKEAKQGELSHKKASVYKRTVHGRMTADEPGQVALEKGNITSVQNLNVLRKARAEIFAEDDFDKNILVDLFLRREHFRTLEHLKAKTVTGFVQELSMFPFYISMYTEKQLNILKRLYALNEHTVLHLDSTGSVCGKLPENYGTTRQFYYALVCWLPEAPDAPCIPIFELVSNSHSAATVSHVLHWFFEIYGKYSGSKRSAFGIRRLETDCSRALISGVLQALEQGNTYLYLRHAWFCLITGQKMDFVHHVCRSHTVKFGIEAIKSHYAGKEESIHAVKRWMKRFVIGKDMFDFERRVDDIVLIAGKKWLTEDVKTALTNMDIPTSRSAELNCRAFRVEEFPVNGPFYARSPFGYFSLARCYHYNIDINTRMYQAAGFNDESGSSSASESYGASEKNPHFNKEFLEYLIKHVLSLGCLLNHSLLALNEMNRLEDTNAVSESWNKILKNDEMKMELPMRIGRLVSRLEDNLKGRIAQFDLAVSRMERKAGIHRKQGNIPDDKTDDSEDEMDLFKRRNQKSSLNPERATEMWGKRKGSRPPARNEDLFQQLSLLPYGGSFVHGGKQVTLRNTCNIDNTLQILYTLYSIEKPVKTYLDGLAQEQGSVGESLVNVFRYVDSGHWNLARKVTLVALLKLPMNELMNGDLYESEDRLLKQLGELFIVTKKFHCKNTRCLLPKESDICPMRDSAVIFPQMITDIFVAQQIVPNCYMCNFKELVIENQWPAIGAPPFFCYYLEQVGNVCNESDLLEEQTILGITYNLFAYTVLNENHYTTVFYYKGKRFIYDGIKSEKLQKFQPAGEGHSLSTVWLIKKP